MVVRMVVLENRFMDLVSNYHLNKDAYLWIGNNAEILFSILILFSYNRKMGQDKCVGIIIQHLHDQHVSV